MRLFTAVDIRQDVKNTIEALVDRLRPLAKLRWTPPDKLHITTKFIGEWPEDRLDEIKSALAQVTLPYPVDVSIRRLGWLPNPRFPRVLFAAVEATESLQALTAATERALEPLGVAREDRVYRPHVTLARVKDEVPDLKDVDTSDIGSYQARSFFLYLSAAGKYTKLQEFRLQNP